MAIVSSNRCAELRAKIESRNCRVGVIGLGYAGLPLAAALAEAGFVVTGVDEDPERIRSLGAGVSYLPDVASEVVGGLVARGQLQARGGYDALAGQDVVVIAVPTRLKKTRDPDLGDVVAVCQELAARLHPGQLVVLESTTYPGATEELVRPLLEASGLRVGSDLFLCCSPERVDPGNRTYGIRNTPKVVGGCSAACVELGALFYEQAIERVVAVRSTRVAEMVKLLENTFRMINIGLVNELAQMCHRMGIDVWEVIDAAATKPFGYLAFYPGPGLGGHETPSHPFHLSWKSKQAGIEARCIELAGTINGEMPRYVVSRVQDALNRQRKALNGARVHVVGVSYKRDIADVRESPAVDVLHLLRAKKALVSYSDEFVAELRVDGVSLQHVPLAEGLAGCDCAVIVTDHRGVDYEEVVRVAPVVLDTRNACKGISSEKIVRL